jgi:putative tricarboxylic transport membrane protein
MKIDDLGLGLLVLVAALAVLVSSLQFSPIPGQAYGADTMPQAIGLVALVLALVLIARAVRAGARVPRITRTDWARSPRALASLALTVGLVVAYILLADRVGFIPVAFVVLLLLMLALGVRPLTALLVAAVAALVIQAAFGRLLLVPLPPTPFLAGFW